MIDVSKCEYEESFREPEYEFTVHYFVYPKSMDEIKFCDEKEYDEFSGGKIVQMCVSLTLYDNGEFYMQMTPTIEDEDGLHDVDWRDLELGVNYTEDTVAKLIKKTKICSNCDCWVRDKVFCSIHHESKTSDNWCPSHMNKEWTVVS